MVKKAVGIFSKKNSCVVPGVFFPSTFSPTTGLISVAIPCLTVAHGIVGLMAHLTLGYLLGTQMPRARTRYPRSSVGLTSRLAIAGQGLDEVVAPGEPSLTTDWMRT